MRYFYFLLSLLFIVLCSSCSKKIDYLPIPKESEIVIKLNTSQIGKKIFFEKAKDFNLKDLFSFKGQDSLSKETFWERLLNDPRKAGIEYLDPVYLFQFEGEKFAVISLDNKKDFDEFIKGANGKINDFGNGISNSQLSDFSIAWNKKLAILQWNSDNNILKEIIKLKKEETIFIHNDFQKTTSLTDDVVCYFQPEKLLPEGSLTKQLKILNDMASVLKINFENGSIRLETDNLIHPETEKLFEKLIPENISKIEVQNSLASLYFKIHPSILARIESSSNDNGINKRNIISGLTGEFYGNLFRINSGTKTYTTYEMDEDFNKIEIIDTIDYYFPSLNILLPIKNVLAGKTILNNLAQDGYLTNIKENYTFDLLNFPIQLSVNENYIIATDSIPVLNQNKKSNFKADNTCLLLNINPSHEIEKLIGKNFDISALKQIQISGTKIDKENVQINARISFKDANKNSLIQLIDLRKSPLSPKPVL